VTTDNDVANLQRGNRILDRGGFPAMYRAIRRDDVSRRSLNEQFPWSCLGQSIGVDSRIGAGDEQGQGILPLNQRLKQLLVLAEGLTLKLMNSMNELLHRDLAPQRECLCLAASCQRQI
jgi:hypothetical protein